jgi:membrane-associated phospholipid phosphatase
MNSPEALPDVVTTEKAVHAEKKKIVLNKDFAFRTLITVAALAVWFWTQSMLGTRSAPTAPIGDGLHNLTASLNAYFQSAPRAANALLIVSSALIDAIAIFLIAGWICFGKLRPFLGLAILLVTRQVLQALCSLPPPPGIIWHDPGFPSLLVTYGVANDFFFSGHTAIAVFGAIELARLRRTWLTGLAIFVAVVEIAAVVVLRAHYTMDVFTGALAAVCVAQICRNIPDRSARVAAGRAG